MIFNKPFLLHTLQKTTFSKRAQLKSVIHMDKAII